MEKDITKEDREILNKFQIFQQQLQTIVIQKEDAKLQILETERALEELSKSDVKEAYKIAGQIMIKRNADEIKKELEEKIKDLELRTKTLERTEEKIVNKLKEIEPKIKKLIEK